MLSKNIDTEFLDDFPKKELKENYDWELISVSKDDTNKRSVFCGINKNDKNDCIHVKQFKIFIDQNSNQEIKQIHKEINYLCLLQQYDCIVKLDDIIVDKDIDTKKLYLIFRGNTISLNKMINSNYYNNLNNDDLIKWIIFQISGIIHNDMKPSNILIDQVSGIFYL